MFDMFQPVLDILGILFTPEQQKALLIITIAVIAMTQVFKHTYFAFFPETNKRKKVAKMWLFSFGAGFVLGIVGYLSDDLHQPFWFWGFSGVSSGAGAILAFKAFIEWPAKFAPKGNSTSDS